MNISFISGLRNYSYNNFSYNNYRGANNSLPTPRVNTQFYLAKDCVNFTAKTDPTMTKEQKADLEKLNSNLKNIEGLHDPYSDVIIITQNKINSFHKKMEKNSSIDKTIQYLEGFKQNMFANGEARVFDMLKKTNEIWKMDPDLENEQWDFADILRSKYIGSRKRLVTQQYQVLDDIIEYSKDALDKHDQKIIKKAVKDVENTIDDDTFRINTCRTRLYETTPELHNKNAIKDIKHITMAFPNGSNSIDSFIVKNADKTHEEIADALLEPSIGSIEHIKPRSKRGKSDPINYLVATRRMNSLRQALTYDEFKEYVPDLPEKLQRYTDEIIQKTNNGQTNVGMFLQDVKEAIYDQSSGDIDIDISELDPKFINDYREYVNSYYELCNSQGWKFSRE